jgi:phospholipid/cholesterol/gamma-HCH transport system ATP-binding protein
LEKSPAKIPAAVALASAVDSAEPRTPLGEVIIRFSHVTKRFGPKIVFSDLSLELRRGETTAILGASGSGKSVLLKMLIGLIPKDSGTIEFDGEDLSNLDDKEYGDVRRRIAYVFQGAALFDSLSVRENVAYGLREQSWKTMSEAEIQARITHCLELVGLPGTQDMRPPELSGGMQKRVGLARTLALQPQVILYDEPTTGLDPINAARINELILGIQHTLKITSVVVTHDMVSAFSVSNRIAMLGRGKVIAFAVRDEFRKTTDPYVRDFIEGKAPAHEDVKSLLSST